MSKIKKSILECVGNTPIIQIDRFKDETANENNLFAKVEFFNPGGSVKDRIALEMIKKAYDNGDINANSVIIEPTSGNTGIGLAIACAVFGNKLILTMPESMSDERKKLLKYYGAELVLTPASLGMQGSVDMAKELHKSNPNSFIPSQFTNLNNPLVHKRTTAIEIIEAFDNEPIDYFVSGIGTGGTISGVGAKLKEKYPNIKIIAVEPSDSPLLSEGKIGPHGIQGIGANFVPDTLNLEIFDKIIAVNTNDAYVASRKLAQSEGILVGISSGAVLHAASKIKDKNKNILILLPDTGERYLSTPLFEQ